MAAEKFDIRINLTPDIALNVKINSVMNHEEFLGFIQQIEGLFKPFVKQQMNFETSEIVEKPKSHKKREKENVGIGQKTIKKYATKVISLMKKEDITATDAFRRLIGTIPTGGEYAFMRQCGIQIGGKHSNKTIIVEKKQRKERQWSPENKKFMSERMKTINAKTKEFHEQFPEKYIKTIRQEAVAYFENVVKPTQNKKEEEKKKFNAVPESVEDAFKMFGGN